MRFSVACPSHALAERKGLRHDLKSILRVTPTHRDISPRNRRLIWITNEEGQRNRRSARSRNNVHRSVGVS